MFRAPPTSSLLAQEGRTVNAFSAIYSTLTSAWFSWSPVGCGGCRGFCTTWDTMDECYLSSDFATQCQQRPQLGFYWSTPVIVLIIGLFSVQLDSLVFADTYDSRDVAYVLVVELHSFQADLCVCYSPLLVTEVVTPSGKGLFVRASRCNRD